MISVVIPTFNEEKMIEGCLKQFLPFKKKFGLELIVSDGGSSDNTVMIARRFADTVVVWKKRGRSNIPQGRNSGCFASTGDLLFVTDADCRVKDLDFFFKEVIARFADKKLVGLTGDVLVNPKERKFVDIIHHFFNFFNCLTNLLHIGGARGEFQVIRSSAFKKLHGYDERLTSSEDYDLFFRLRKFGKIKFVCSLVVFESARRYRQLGYPRVLITWFYEGLYHLITGKAPFKEWKVVR